MIFPIFRMKVINVHDEPRSVCGVLGWPSWVSWWMLGIREIWMYSFYTLDQKLTWNPKVTPFNRNIILQNFIFALHVSFQGCIYMCIYVHMEMNTLFQIFSLGAWKDSAWLFCTIWVYQYIYLFMYWIFFITTMSNTFLAELRVRI